MYPPQLLSSQCSQLWLQKPRWQWPKSRPQNWTSQTSGWHHGSVHYSLYSLWCIWPDFALLFISLLWRCKNVLECPQTTNSSHVHHEHQPNLKPFVLQQGVSETLMSQSIDLRKTFVLSWRNWEKDRRTTEKKKLKPWANWQTDWRTSSLALVKKFSKMHLARTRSRTQIHK